MLSKLQLDVIKSFQGSIIIGKEIQSLQNKVTSVFFSFLHPSEKDLLLSVSEKCIILKYRSLNIKSDSVLVFLQQITRSYWKLLKQKPKPN